VKKIPEKHFALVIKRQFFCIKELFIWNWIDSAAFCTFAPPTFFFLFLFFYLRTLYYRTRLFWRWPKMSCVEEMKSYWISSIKTSWGTQLRKCCQIMKKTILLIKWYSFMISLQSYSAFRMAFTWCSLEQSWEKR
jgi:hypothetical protein